jgi:hypothetical protein
MGGQAGTGWVACALVPFIAGGAAAAGLVVVVSDIHYKAEANHDGRLAVPQNGSQMPSWEYTALLVR